MALNRVQCGDCLRLRIFSLKEPVFENGHCVKWICKICGQEGPAIGRERRITPEAWAADGEQAKRGGASG